MFIPAGSIIGPMYIDASDNNPTITGEGCVFTNVVFMNPSIFGEGCVFVNCVFLDGQDPEHSGMHVTGNGNIFTDCVFNYTQFGSANVSNVMPLAGIRPNIPASDMEFTSDTDTTPLLHLEGCPVCGKVRVVNNGNVVADNNMENPAQQTAGGNIITNTGVCPACT